MEAWTQGDLFDPPPTSKRPQGDRVGQSEAFVSPKWSGKSFVKGKLFVFERNQIFVARPYPDVRVWSKSKSRPAWRGISPSLFSVAWPRVIRPKTTVPFVPDFAFPESRPPGPEESTKRGDRAIAAFLESVPAEVLAAVMRFRSPYRIGMLALVGRCPGALDIVQGNGCLAFLLMMNRVFRRPAVESPWDAARRWVRRRQRDALGWLGGWPATESAAKLTRRVAPESLSVPFCFRLRSLIASGDDANPLLRHLPRLTSDVVALLASPDTRDCISSSLIEEVSAAKPDVTGRPRVFWLVRDALRIADAAQRRLPRRFRSVREVQAVHGDLLDWFQYHADAWIDSELCELVFPDPPIPVPFYTQPREMWIEPIRNGRELLNESRDQHNCVFSYARDILNQRVAVYSVRKPERATVSLVPGDHGGWVIDQFLAARNKPVRRETLFLVAGYLGRQQSKLAENDPPAWTL